MPSDTASTVVDLVSFKIGRSDWDDLLIAPDFGPRNEAPVHAEAQRAEPPVSEWRTQHGPVEGEKRDSSSARSDRVYAP